ncbi:ankyrin repeat domain-containing protein 49 [Erpetoichthys calabaricus]|uniref:Ankyrin repeat domain 49 n=1 Tax=Erpetoichthys calabaricus TaxID=27687 RepID=A0A8C4RJE3_ERPCA|nr:ankyrin repeat domain-containing protein 49 [Erpetoichthys calabaricus]XP_028656344.1 ankyrin repeat domain-containing protein 49 [Erpetoichthys calabaricus]
MDELAASPSPTRGAKMDFPEDFNQLELLDTHRHLIPVGTHSLWPEEEEEEDDDYQEAERDEEWYQQEEMKRENYPDQLLLWACEKNRLSTVKRLLSAHVELVNVTDDDQYTPLHRAAYSGHLEVVQELLAHNANIHAKTVDGWTPLHSACKWNNAKVASYLLQNGADINAQTNGLLTPLHLVAGSSNSHETLELLLMNRHLQPQLKSSSNETALDIARRTSLHYCLFEIVDACTNSTPE